MNVNTIFFLIIYFTYLLTCVLCRVFYLFLFIYFLFIKKCFFFIYCNLLIRTFTGDRKTQWIAISVIYYLINYATKNGSIIYVSFNHNIFFVHFVHDVRNVCSLTSNLHTLNIIYFLSEMFLFYFIHIF